MKKSMTLLVLISLLGPALAQISPAENQEVAVIVNPKNPVNTVTKSELRKIFAGEKRTWPGGVSVKLIVRVPGSYERVVLLRLLGMSESEYKQHWIAQVFHGEAQAEPVALFSNGMQKEAIGAFPGAIALVTLGDVKPAMKVLKVDGHLPGEPGYPVY
ncbi:MAG TPA: substrate-binding domain-containing protein [Candidatus Acidoferrum sp.]|jgi:phosphate transport system substrate-binding protein|nr:substrate-binding domain-containing protein [Candidatus Acidoferrum sp.]